MTRSGVGASLTRTVLVVVVPSQMWAALFSTAIEAKGWDRVGLMGLSLLAGAQVVAGTLLYSTYRTRR